MRRLSPVDAMLLGTVLLWALNVTVTKYMFLHGWQPLAYAVIRYFCATALFWAYTYWRERSFRIDRADVPLVALAGVLIFANQICFVYGLDLGAATTMALLLATTPIFIGLVTVALRLEHLHRQFWVGAAFTFLGVLLITVGTGGGFSSSIGADLLALTTALTWGCYTIVISRLMPKYSPFRISALVLAIGWVPLFFVSLPQLTSQQFDFGWTVWLGFVYAVLGPLFLTNILWFTAVDRVGPSRASLFSNLQPFFAVVFALILLSESLQALEVVGGILIFTGIAIERAWRGEPAAAPPGD